MTPEEFKWLVGFVVAQIGYVGKDVTVEECAERVAHHVSKEMYAKAREAYWRGYDDMRKSAESN